MTVYHRVPISPIPNNEVVFGTFVMDRLGPIFPNQKVKFNYCLVLIDRVSRFLMAYALTSFSAKNVCNALIQMFQVTGIPSVILWNELYQSINTDISEHFWMQS